MAKLVNPVWFGRKIDSRRVVEGNFDTFQRNVDQREVSQNQPETARVGWIAGVGTFSLKVCPPDRFCAWLAVCAEAMSIFIFLGRQLYRHESRFPFSHIAIAAPTRVADRRSAK